MALGVLGVLGFGFTAFGILDFLGCGCWFFWVWVWERDAVDARLVVPHEFQSRQSRS